MNYNSINYTTKQLYFTKDGLKILKLQNKLILRCVKYKSTIFNKKIVITE